MSDSGNEYEKLPVSEQIKDVYAVGIFVNRQMILKTLPESSFEAIFKEAYKDFKSECLSFLEEVEEKDDLLVRHYDIMSKTYTMFFSEVGDKESVFLMMGEHNRGFPATETLHMTVNAIINSLSNINENDNNCFSSIEEVFRSMDTEGVGAIDEEEFSIGLDSLGLNWKTSKIHKLFNQIDIEKNEEISFDVFLRFMKKSSNKKSWKELQRTITESIRIPTVKSIQKSNIAADKYMRKLSQMEKLVNMMEEAMIEQEFPTNEQLFWRNKIFANREFIRKHQDVIGRVLGQENSRLKKRVAQLEQDLEMLPEMKMQVHSMPPKFAQNSDSNTNGRRNRSNSTSNESANKMLQHELLSNQAQIKRLRRENQDYKRKIQSQQQEIRKANTNRKRAISSNSRNTASISRRSSQSSSNLEISQLEDMLGKLKKTNYELRNEKHSVTKERDQLRIQLQAAKHRMQKLGNMVGDDEDLLRQLAIARRDAKNYRKDKQKLEANCIKISGLNEALKKKLLRLAKRIRSYNEQMSIRLISKKSANEMIDELASQLISMLDNFESLRKENELLKKTAKTHANEVRNLIDDIKELRLLLNEKDKEIEELHQSLNAGNEELEEYNERLLDMENVQQLLKEQYRKVKEMEAEINIFSGEREMNERALEESQMKCKNFRKQLRILKKMPGNKSMLKKIERLFNIFQQLDENNDGFLSFEDFEKGAQELGFGDTFEEQKAIFDMMDANNDGMIDFTTFKIECLKRIEGKQQSDKEWKMTYRLLNKPPGKWNNEDVNMWLTHIGMQDEYDDKFENVNGNILINVSNTKDLKKMGISKTSHVRKIMREIKDLKARDELISNLQYENTSMIAELNDLKSNGPTWQAVHLLQRKVRDLDGKLRKEKFARENIMICVKDELKCDDRFDDMSPDYIDVLAEVALLKGALANNNQQLKILKHKQLPVYGSEFENLSSIPQKMRNYGQPIGRFLQKWYVLANHSTQYWISRTNDELDERDQHFRNVRVRDRDRYGTLGSGTSFGSRAMNIMDDEEEKLQLKNDMSSEKFTEELDWIFFDTRKKRIVSELRMRGRGAQNDPKDIKLQVSVSPSGPWTTVIENQMGNHNKRQIIGRFKAHARFWRIVFMNNYGENSPSAPRYVLYECQFWGPLDEDVENNHFVIE